MNEKFIAFATRHFAEMLGIEEGKVEELYDFVNTRFSIEVRSNKDQTFSSILHYTEPDEDYGEDVSVISWEQFATAEDARKAAHKNIKSVEFCNHNVIFAFGQYPKNMLILFDKDYQKS